MACRQMDTVTYLHPDVRAELEHWLEYRVDVTHAREVALLFEVTAVPVAVVVAADGTILKRIPNFVEPGSFCAALERVRGAD